MNLKDFFKPSKAYVGTAKMGEDRVYLIRVLGEGGEGIAYEAREAGEGSDPTRFVIKIPVPRRMGDPDFGEECRLFDGKEDLRHCAIPRGPEPIRLRDGTDTKAVMMDLYEDGTLARYQKARNAEGAPLTVGESAGIMAQITIGLRESGLVHRDIKPSNLLMNEGKIAVADWGLAINPGTSIRAIEGSLDYMPPESIRHQSPASEKHDSYAVGLIGFEMATRRPGRVLPDGDDDMERYDAILNDKRVRVTRKDDHFDETLRFASHHDPAVRSSHLDLLTDLAKYPEARQHFNTADRQAIAEHLIKRSADLPDRSPILDRGAAEGLLEYGKWSETTRSKLRRVLDGESDDIAHGSPDFSKSFKGQAHGFSVEITLDLRGEAIKFSESNAKRLSPSFAKVQQEEWARSAAANEFSPAQRDMLVQVKANVPHLNGEDSVKIAQVLAKDWDIFRRARAGDAGEAYVRISDQDGSFMQGMVKPDKASFEKDGQWLSFDRSGKLLQTIDFDKGKIHGEVRSFDDRGLLEQRQEFHQGEPGVIFSAQPDGITPITRPVTTTRSRS